VQCSYSMYSLQEQGHGTTAWRAGNQEGKGTHLQQACQPDQSGHWLLQELKKHHRYTTNTPHLRNKRNAGAPQVCHNGGTP